MAPGECAPGGGVPREYVASSGVCRCRHELLNENYRGVSCARVDRSTGQWTGSTPVERDQQAGGPGPRLIPVHRGVDPVH